MVLPNSGGILNRPNYPMAMQTGRTQSVAIRDMNNALTVDVEDFFQVSAFTAYIDRSSWDTIGRRVESNVDRLLLLFEERGASATFFTLGWIAERHPSMIRRIVAAGHELASHGYGHVRATEQTPADFRNDILRAKRVLEDLSGLEVQGYRAPSFSIGEANPWAYDELFVAGYRYSSSVYPVRHDHYGVPHAPRFPYKAHPGILEIPLSTIRGFGKNWPASGGGFFRLLPYSVSRAAIARVNRMDCAPAIFYFHPWEVDPSQPRIPGIDFRTRFRHYVNLDRTMNRIERLLDDFRWDRIDRVFAMNLRDASGHAMESPAVPLPRVILP